MYQDDLDYARKRLEGTLVRKTNGNPFIVDQVLLEGTTMVCFGVDLTSEITETIPLANIDLTPVKLGFVNYNGKMVFACRKPMRKDWKQGLSLNSLVVYGTDKRDIGLRSLTKTVMNNYPSVADCVAYLKKTKNRSMAFSRDFGLSNRGEEVLLVYRKYEVGKLTDGRLVLNPDKFFLEQHLAEVVG